MLNSAATGRRLALRAAVYQTVIVLLVALVFLIRDGSWALAALVGGGAVILGGALSARLALGNRVIGAGTALGRLFAAMILKWCVVVLALALALAVFELPPLPLLGGVVVATLAYVMTNSIKQ